MHQDIEKEDHSFSQMSDIILKKRSRLTDDEKKSVALSPDAVVERVVDVVQQTTAKLNAEFDMIVEPCAGDGRLGRAIEKATKKTLLLFDVYPQNNYVQNLDVLDERDIQNLTKTLTGHRCLVVLNPPFNPKDKFNCICSASLGLEGAEQCVLVLPGVYRDVALLDKLLPRWWHVEHIENMDYQKFEQPLLNKHTSDIMLAIVFAVRKTYLRQSLMEDRKDRKDRKSTRQISFCFVDETDDWDQAFHTGGIKHPIQVKNRSETRPQHGRWKFVKYLHYATERELEQICELVKVRTSYATTMKVFPVYGTTDRVAVSKDALCDWLHQILHGDALFFQGLHQHSGESPEKRKKVAD